MHHVAEANTAEANTAEARPQVPNGRGWVATAECRYRVVGGAGG